MTILTAVPVHHLPVMHNRLSCHVCHTCPHLFLIHDARQVVYGLDFPAEQRAAQLEAVRKAILEHVAWARDPLVVIEEYDKLDCAARAMLRDLLDHADPGSGLSRCVHRHILIISFAAV